MLGLLVTPGPDARSSTNPDEQAAEKQSFELNKSVRNLFRQGYTATLDWDKLSEARDVPFIIHSALMGGLYRLNAQPWKLGALPFETEPAGAVYFLGLVGDDELYIASGMLFDYEGAPVAYGAFYPDKNLDIEGFSTEIHRLIQSILTDGIHKSRPEPAHMIVHISPEMAAYVDSVRSALQGLSFDILLVHPGAGPRLLQLGNQQGTPSHGIAVGSEEQEQAYLVNTRALAERTDRGYIYPDPNTVVIRRLAGATSIKTLAAHAFWLSVAHINALHRTVDTPTTIAYAQALCEYVKRKRQSMHVSRTYRRTLYWL